MIIMSQSPHHKTTLPAPKNRAKQDKETPSHCWKIVQNRNLTRLPPVSLLTYEAGFV